MLRFSLLTAVTVAAACSTAMAAKVLPYTELFSSNNSLWTQNNNTAANWLSPGGVDGGTDGYITTLFTVPTAITGTPVIARATASNNPSGGLFIGDYSDIETISYYVKTDAAFAVPFGLRLGGATPGTAIVIDGGLVQPGSDWTLITFDLSPTNPNIISYEGTPGADDAAKFTAATSNVANLQAFLYLAKPGYVPPATATPVTFSVDSVAVVPEPTSLTLLGLAAPLMLARRRRKTAAPIA
jgi:hypothetical protein